jgi:hypothetical protein
VCFVWFGHYAYPANKKKGKIDKSELTLHFSTVGYPGGDKDGVSGSLMVLTPQTTPERLEKLPLWEKLTAEAAKLTLAEEVAKELTSSEDQESAAGKKSTTEHPTTSEDEDSSSSA